MNKREADDLAWSLAEEKKKRKRSRWASDDKTFIPGMPTVIPHGLSKDQEEQYMVHLQIEEISRRLRTGDLGIPLNPEERSPSPEPIYNSEGKRLNTREYRTRKKLEEDRHRFITRAFELNTEYKPPADYKPPIIRVHDKVMIPQEEHPDINFVGLLIGPRGNTLKNLEKDTGAKIIIRGKGSVKEGKIGRKDGQPLPGEDEPLHAYVTANNPENVKKAVDKIKEIIKQGIEVPEGQNDLRRQQLRELALLNGTLRENDGLSKLKQLQQAQTIITNTIICTVCGGTGHIAQDCKQKRPGDTLRAQLQQPAPSPIDKAKMDSEYMSLMAELGEGPPPPKQDHGHSSFSAMTSHPARQFTSQPPPMINQTSHWHTSNPPAPHQHQPKPMLSLPPPTNMNPPPQHHMAPPPPTSIAHPPPQQSQPSNPMIPPWQQQQQPPPVSTPVSVAPTTAVNMGVPPPNVLAAPPPPPPPNSQPQVTSGYPWQPPPQQQQQQHHHHQGAMPVPPPPTGMAHPPWQSGPVPPPPPANMTPWQQGPPPAVSTPMPPPPPPPSGYTTMAPPPPPPDMGSLAQAGMHGIPLGVPPPPPPN